MSCSPDTIVLAVDGGGTRCRVALSDGDQIWQVEVGAANVSTDFEAALSELQRGLAQVSQLAGVEKTKIIDAPAYLGLAGITGRQLVDRLGAALPFSNLRIEDDRRSALRGALGVDDGFVAHCGTGSFLAAQQAGEVRFAGGWGPVLGDQASAQWVGRLLLSKVLDSSDGMTEPSELSEKVLSRFEGEAGIVKAASTMSPAEFGALSPMVTQGAAQGDTLAISIMRAGSGYLEDRLVRMGWGPGLPICLTGGIGPHYAAYLPEPMRKSLREPLGDPLSGAIALAHAFKEEIANERC